MMTILFIPQCNNITSIFSSKPKSLREQRLNKYKCLLRTSVVLIVLGSLAFVGVIAYLGAAWVRETVPVRTRRNNNVIIAPKRRRNVVFT